MVKSDKRIDANQRPCEEFLQQQLRPKTNKKAKS